MGGWGFLSHRQPLSLTMSHQPGNNELQSKRQKLSGDGDEKEAAELITLGGPMYDEATARKMLQEVVLVSADKAEDGEAVIGFDPDDASLDNLYFVDDDYFRRMNITPMMYFVRKGDAKMCRYLISRGASTTKKSEGGNPRNVTINTFPMYIAADRGHLDICKVLYANGAQNDVSRGDGDGLTPFHIAVFHGHDDVVRWLVLQGALCANASSEEIGEDGIYPEGYCRELNRVWFVQTIKRLVEWAKEVIQSHSAVVMFLLGTLPPAPDTDQVRTLQCLSGYPGVRKHVADFVGLEVTKGKQLRILRSVVDVLPSFIRTDDEEE